MSSRQQILERIRAVRQTEQKLPDNLPDRILPLEELRERFIVSCSITGTGVHVLSSMEEATFLFMQKAGSCSFYIGPGLPGNNSIEDPVRTDYALLKGDFGVAENNAIWLQESSMGDRVIPFASLHLYLLVSEEDLVADMHEAYHNDLIFKEGFGVFIAGPSKTADIEQSLVIGAHGPLSLDIVLITNL